jgi:hypothetical protein
MACASEWAGVDTDAASSGFWRWLLRLASGDRV